MEYTFAGERHRRRFVQLAGSGLDARATELVDWKLKQRIGRYAYVVAGLQALRERCAPIQVSDGSRKFAGRLVLLGNGRLYGGSIPVFRQADLRDGLLDVCVFPKVNWFVMLRYAFACLSPRLLRQVGEHCFQAKSLLLESTAKTPLELDGEPVGHLPARCSIHSKLLRVIVP
jgi:diacylglycerol kinase family enzyme